MATNCAHSVGIRPSFFVIAMLGIFALTTVGRAEDIINVDVTGVDPEFRQTFRESELFWQSRIIGYSNELPRIVQNQLNPLEITANTFGVDGPGGILGFAAVTRTVLHNTGGTRPNNPPIAIAQEAIMVFDTFDLPFLVQTGTLGDVVRHEMAHALGFGSLWVDNDLIGPRNNQGEIQYTNGEYALEAFREESGNPFAQFVPLEQAGGGGSALSHWDDVFPFLDPLLNRQETMTAFLDPNRIPFVSETTWGAMADLWYEVEGINDDDFGDVVIWPGGPKTWGRPGFPPLFNRQVPEPSSAAVLVGLGLFTACYRRRRR